MNRILFETDEIVDGIATFGGERAEHVMNVLHGEVGQVLKTGEIDGLIGTSEIISIAPYPTRPRVEAHTSSDRFAAASPGDTADGSAVTAPRGEDASGTVRITVHCSHTERSLAPWVDLILAPPRPRVMKRLLPQLATMGVGRIFLVGARKVEKDFWGATLLKPENYRPLLIDGLMQAGTSILPILETRRNFRKFVKEELDTLWPEARRIVAHPYTVPDAPSRRGADKTDCCYHATTRGRVGYGNPLLAIGPEGGWTDEEVALLEEHGFARYSLGSRILRTDTATIALLAQLMKEFGAC